MKIAIIHDWLVAVGGAEKVLEQIIKCYFDADIFSLVDFLSNDERNKIIMGKKVKTSFIQKLPFAKKYFRYYLPFFPKAIESFNLENYDLIISSSWAFAKGIKKPKHALHICYCHTPIRYAWDMFDEYTQNLLQPKKWLVQKSLKKIQKWDLTSDVDFFISNSKYVSKRIKNIYNKDSKVIYPPVNTDNLMLKIEKKNYYLTASRLVRYKKTSIIVKAFNEMKLPLVVIGDGEELKYIKKIASPNVKILGYQDDTILKKYMQNAKAFIFMALEDFGIVPIEALSCGTPVITYGYGGASESIIDGQNGLHVKKQSVDSLIYTVKKFEQMDKTFDAKKLHKRAQIFSINRFKNEFKTFIDEKFVINKKNFL